MDNSYFIYSSQGQRIDIERFHICSWEFLNNLPMIEFGFEVSSHTIPDHKISLYLYIPWYNSNCKLTDLYENLKDTANSKFIFNDSVISTKSLDGGSNNYGIIHRFSGRNKLCLLPVEFESAGEGWINIEIDLKYYKSIKKAKPNIYCRFLIKPDKHYTSMRKKGIAKSTVIYDFKINEQRNIQDNLLRDKREKEFCNIKSCFCFTIIPNKYDFVFLDNASLQSVRTLEYESFHRYLKEDKVKKDELIVIFNKKRTDNTHSNDIQSYSFFSMFSKERIGKVQFVIAILLNVFCGILFFIASFRSAPKPNTKFVAVLSALPFEIYLAFFILIGGVFYLIWPSFHRKSQP